MFKKNKQIVFDYKREYDWLIIAQSYFQCALMSARVLKKKLSNFFVAKGSPLEHCLKEIYGDDPEQPAYLIFPILFNLKHGTEIYLKAIIGIQNSKFPKGHDLTTLLKAKEVNLKKKEICIIKKYAFSQLLLLKNQKADIENQFERYPQGSPYDSLELFPLINDKGKTITPPQGISFHEYFTLAKKNKAEVIPLINQEKIDELIRDAEFLLRRLREASFIDHK